MTFVPPKVNRNQWATYVQDRNPQFKVHTSEGKANQAVSYHFPPVPVTKYWIVDGEWVVHTDYKIPDTCMYCDQPYTTDRWGRKLVHAAWTYKGNKPDAPLVCEACFKKDKDEYFAKEAEKRDLKKLAELKAKYEA